jgi:uncharacterized protein YneF (UPF0154 family)
MTITLTQILIGSGIVAIFSVILLTGGIFIGYYLSRKTLGYRNVVEDQDITE